VWEREREIDTSTEISKILNLTFVIAKPLQVLADQSVKSKKLKWNEKTKINQIRQTVQSNKVEAA
jgi:hypothetical protein